MKHLFWKYVLSVLLVGFGWGNSTEARAMEGAPANVEEGAKQHLEAHADLGHEHPIDLVETTVSLKYSVIFIEVPHVQTYVRIPDHLHSDAHYFTERFVFPPQALYLFFQVFRI